MTILEHFQKAKEVWTNKKIIIDAIPSGWKKNDVFHTAVHGTNGPASRNIYFRLVPEADDFGNVAVFLNKNNQFYQIEATDRGVELTVWCNHELVDKVDAIIGEYKQKSLAFLEKITARKEKKVDIIKTIIIVEKIDEAINSAMNKENNRTVYYSVGKTREYAANIPLLMNASGANLIQLSMNKWMSFMDQMRSKSPDEAFPEDKIKQFCGDALKWKKFIMDFLDGSAW
nr:hypothetical protein [Candidatus Sigynarchaeota archaeon]